MVSSFVFSKNSPIITWQRAGGHGKKVKSKKAKVKTVEIGPAGIGF